MIKKFNLSDLAHFIPNEFSNPDFALDQLVDTDFETYSLWDGDYVAAILCFRRYWGDNWLGFFLISFDFNPRLAVKLKRHIKNVMIERGAKRLQTDSVACDKLNKWHKFLGFKWEGRREKMLFDKDHDLWAIVKEG